MTHDAAVDRAKSACTDLILGFAYLVDQRRYEEIVALFAADGVFERPGFMAQGHQEILAFLTARPLETETRHVCSPPFFDAWTDVRATAVTYVTMFHGPKATDGGPMTIAGAAGWWSSITSSPAPILAGRSPGTKAASS